MQAYDLPAQSAPRRAQRPSLDRDVARGLPLFEDYTATAEYIGSSYAGQATATHAFSGAAFTQHHPFATMPPTAQQSSPGMSAPMDGTTSFAAHTPTDSTETAVDEHAVDLDFLAAASGDLDHDLFTAPKQNGRTLAHGVAAMTGESLAGNKMRGFTGGDLVDAFKSRRAYVTLSDPSNRHLHRAAQETKCSEDDLLQDSADTASQAPTAPAHSIDVQVGMLINIVLPNIPAVPFKRRKGGGHWLPPVGLLEHHLASQEVMKHFDLGASFSPIYSQACPAQADMTLIGIGVTLWELAGFFPTHYRHWKDFTARIAGNGVTPTEFARIVNMIRDTDEREGLLKSTIENQYAAYAPKNTRGKVTTFCCCEWTKPKGLALIDYPLRHLSTGIARKHFPTGIHRGPLTACVEAALDHPEGGMFKLSHVTKLVSELQKQNLDPYAPFQDVFNGATLLNADEAAIGELRPELEAYRVLYEAAKALR